MDLSSESIKYMYCIFRMYRIKTNTIAKRLHFPLKCAILPSYTFFGGRTMIILPGSAENAVYDKVSGGRYAEYHHHY